MAPERTPLPRAPRDDAWLGRDRFDVASTGGALPQEGKDPHAGARTGVPHRDGLPAPVGQRKAPEPEREAQGLSGMGGEVLARGSERLPRDSSAGATVGLS